MNKYLQVFGLGSKCWIESFLGGYGLLRRGRRHRLDGPAWIGRVGLFDPGGQSLWYIHGRKLKNDDNS